MLRRNCIFASSVPSCKPVIMLYRCAEFDNITLKCQQKLTHVLGVAIIIFPSRLKVNYDYKYRWVKQKTGHRSKCISGQSLLKYLTEKCVDQNYTDHNGHGLKESWVTVTKRYALHTWQPACVYRNIVKLGVNIKGTYSCCVEKCCPEGRGSMSVSFVVLWKQEKRLCFWIAVLALYERFLAHSQVSAPSEGRLMTASHGKAESTGKQRKAIGWEGKDRRDGG